MIFNKNKPIKYFAFFDKVLGTGIEKKINGFIHSANNLGWQINKKFFHNKGILEHLKLGFDILFCSEKIIILRSTAHSLILIYPFCLIAAINKNIVLEVPTPHVTSFYELLKYRKYSLSSYFKLFLLILLGPFTFLPFKKIIQYSNEGLWWTIFTKNKIFINTNGIDLSIIPLRNNQPEIIDSINLIGVANISFWHGYDRIIYALNYLINNKVNYKIQFFIIGEGSELNNLILLTKKLNLSNHVNFVPMTKTDDLNYYFSISHLAVGSIGLHRKNLNLASELKAREYTAFGIPFIASGQDLDFKGKVSFRFESPLDNSFMYIVNLIDDIYNKRIVLPKKELIRKYAEEHLSMDLKVNSFLTL